jgi:hypothetical protein
MNLEEFRKALSSDATEENAQLKRQLSDLQTEYHEKLSKLENENDSLKESCRVLCNRCLLLREVLLVYFVVSITPALICRGLRNRWLWLIN